MQEIAMNILDIAYNSIKAKANLIKIFIHDSSKLNIISIQIIDNGSGMDKTTVKKVIDPFYTTRTTRKVGLGIPMFKENIEATGGKFSIKSV
ncbi:MAG: ATP-binding protein [Thomasclavelia sp.]